MLSSPALESHIKQAFQVGLSPGQLGRFALAGYAPQEKQMEFHGHARAADHPDGPTMVAMGGGRGGAKSHAALCQVALDDCQRIPGSKWLYLRSVGKSARESFEDFLTKAVPSLWDHYVSSRMKISFPNGSEILLGGFRTEKDIENYIGLEYDGILMDDAQLVPYQRRAQVFGSMRTSKQNWRPRGYLTFNPGGVGHAQLVRDFVTPWRRGQESGSRFVFVLPQDNIFINPEYMAYLEGLTGWLRKAWYLGDFDIHAGQFFTTYNEQLHAVQPFELPDGWRQSYRIWCSMDHGYHHPTDVQLHIKDTTGQIYTIAEHWAQRWPVKDHADAIKAMLEQHGLELGDLDSFVAGTDVYAKRDEGPSVAEKYAAEGIHLEPANTDRIQGWAHMLALLGDQERDIPPRWRIWNTCTQLLETIPILETDPRRPEDVLKVDIDPHGFGGDDPGDCARYGLMSESSGVKTAPNPFYD